MIPNSKSKEVFLLALHTAFLVLRTYLSVLVARLDGMIVRDLVTANGRGFLRGLGLWFALAIPSTYTNSMVSWHDRVVASSAMLTPPCARRSAICRASLRLASARV